MNLQKNRFGHRRCSPQRVEDYTPPLTNRTNIDFRKSALNDYHINLDQDSIASYNRYSFDQEAKPVIQRRLQPEVSSTLKSFDNIRSTLTELKKKLDTANQELRSNQILNKNIIFQESEDEEMKPFQLISFSESSGSQKFNASSLDESKREFLQQLRKYDIPDIGQIKGYYKIDVAKAVKEGCGDVLNHIAFNWKVLRSAGGLQEPPAEAILIQKTNIKIPYSGKRTLVIGLDGTLVHVDDNKKNEQDIDVILKTENNKQKKLYICLRPYAMTFLKRMSKLYEIIIFSQRNKAQTDAVMDVLDPFNEMVKARLSRENCMKIRNGVVTKDLRIIDRDLAQTLIIDTEPYSYLFQVDNAVPIIPFRRGSDDQLYGLEKYLLEALRNSDLRKFNRSNFQIGRYSQFGSAFEVIQNLYLLRQ